MAEISLQPERFSGLDLWFNPSGLAHGKWTLLEDLSARGTLAKASSASRAATAGNKGLTFDGNDLYVIPDGASLNLRPSASRTLTFAIETGADIDSMQMLYEQGGDPSGMSVYVKGGYLVFTVWNQTSSGWGRQSISTPVTAATQTAVSLVFDSVAGTLTGYRDGAVFGAAHGVGALRSNGNDIGLGGVAGRSRDADGAILSGKTGGWTGSLLEFSSHDRALTAAEIETLHETAALRAEGGFAASYYVTGKKSALSEIDFDAKPAFTETLTEINKTVDAAGSFWTGGPVDGFAARYKGDFIATMPGVYSFHLLSDDGSALYIDGAQVISNDGLHAKLEKTASVNLSAGTHSIEVRYFEAGGSAVLDLDWSGPGFSRTQLVAPGASAPPPNSAPVAASDGPFAAEAGTPLHIAIAEILRNDMDPDGDSIVFKGLGPVSGGAARVEGDHIVFDALAVGAAAIAYEIGDPSGAVDTGSIAVAVSAPPVSPPPPSITPDFVVAPNGDNGAAGTVAAPFRTIEHAIWRAQPGDVIFVREGVYSGQVNIWKGGAAEAPVTVMAYPGERPIIDGAGTGANTDLVVIGASHVRFEGFEVRGATRSGISVWSASDVAVVDNLIHDAVRGGIWVGSDRLGVSSGHLIEGNVIYNTALENAPWNSSDVWPRALAIDVSTDTVVRGNTVFKNYGEGIGALSSKDLLYQNNIVYDNYSVQMYFDNAQNVTATNNIFFHTGDESFFRSGKPGIGLLIANEYTTYEMPTRGILVQDNIFADVQPVFYDGSYGRGGGIASSVLEPNTILPFEAINPDWTYF